MNYNKEKLYLNYYILKDYFKSFILILSLHQIHVIHYYMIFMKLIDCLWFQIIILLILMQYLLIQVCRFLNFHLVYSINLKFLNLIVNLLSFLILLKLKQYFNFINSLLLILKFQITINLYHYFIIPMLSRVNYSSKYFLNYQQRLFYYCKFLILIFHYYALIE